jgi:HTH-type transcriptional regulator, competence development regulator
MPSEFGSRLRELRKQAGMSQRDVAKKAGIDFTYLSKIESGSLAPPREDKIINIAVILNADKDELITLAGKIPSDLSEILKDKSVVKLLRSASKKEIYQFLKKKEKGED